MNRIYTILSLFVAALLGGAGAASAATISYNYNDFPGYLDMDRFDPTLGVLTGVKLDLQSSWLATAEVSSSDDDGNWVPARFNYTTSIARTLTFGSSALNISYIGSGSVDLPTETLWADFRVDGSASATLSGAAIDFFIGDDTFIPRGHATYHNTGELVVGPGGFGRWSFADSDFYDQLKITYIYTPAGAGAVPEASTWFLMIVGFGGIGVAMRRRAPGRTGGMIILRTA
jgi:hypothetical protein